MNDRLQFKSRAMRLTNANEMRVRRTTTSKYLASVSHWTGLLILMLALQVLSSVAVAQPSNNDFYAPRSGADSKELLQNVLQYHLGPGREEMGNGRWQPALEHFEFILRYYPNHPQALFALSELCQKWKSPACDGIAERWFQKAIERNPEAAQSHVVQAMHLHRKNKLDDAVKSYKRAIELAPNSVNAHYNLGLAYTDLKQYDQANLHAQKSYSLGVTLPALRTRLEKVGKWNPSVSLQEPEAKPAEDVPPPATTEKAPG
jgi:tetratricopeptide (TPR) repeat protein